MAELTFTPVHDEHLEPPPVVEAVSGGALDGLRIADRWPALSGHTTECPGCGGQLPIIDQQPRPVLDRFEMERLARCEQCNAWLRWFQACTARGRPYGRPTVALIRVTDVDQVAWLDHLYGHLIGVIER